MKKNQINFRPVIGSTNVEGEFYDPSTKKLYVLFVSGKAYEYSNVYEDTYRAFKAAPSMGRFVNSVLKQYSHKEVN